MLLRKKILLSAAGLLLILGTSYYWLVLRPATRVKSLLNVMALTQVGSTTTDEFRSMAIAQGIRPDYETPTGIGFQTRNRLLELLHFAPPAVVQVDARTEKDVVTAVSVRAWVGSQGEIAHIDIREFDSHQTGCGDVPVCVKPITSTMVTSVFFTPAVPLEQRKHLLSVNWWCLAKIGGCKSSRELLPSAWESTSPLPQDK